MQVMYEKSVRRELRMVAVVLSDQVHRGLRLYAQVLAKASAFHSRSHSSCSTTMKSAPQISHVITGKVNYCPWIHTAPFRRAILGCLLGPSLIVAMFGLILATNWHLPVGAFYEGRDSASNAIRHLANLHSGATGGLGAFKEPDPIPQFKATAKLGAFLSGLTN